MAAVPTAGRVCLAVGLIIATASFAHAQQRAEIGASLINATIGLGDNDFATVGVPSGVFGILNPGAYASFFLGQRAAIEPQLGLIWFTDGDDSGHIVHFAGQFDYFVQGTGTSSPYILASAGVFGSSDNYNPSYSAGAGYRIRAGDRLAFRVDGRYTRFGGDVDANALAFTLSIGGIFGQ